MRLPEHLTALRRAWLDLSRYVADFQARLFLTIAYFTFAIPFALIARARSPFRRSNGWIARPDAEGELSRARRQF